MKSLWYTSIATPAGVTVYLTDGDDLESYGFATDDDGKPVRDQAGSTVTAHSISEVTELDAGTAIDLYAGADGLAPGEIKDFLTWADRQGLTYTRDQVRDAITLRN